MSWWSRSSMGLTLVRQVRPPPCQGVCMQRALTHRACAPWPCVGITRRLRTVPLGRWEGVEVRWCSSAVSAGEVKKKVEKLTEKFSEARELLDDARSSQNTVYFSEDMSEARQAVGATLDDYQKLLNSLSAEQRAAVLAAIGLKMEELKAHQQLLLEDSPDE